MRADRVVRRGRRTASGTAPARWAATRPGARRGHAHAIARALADGGARRRVFTAGTGRPARKRRRAGPNTRCRRHADHRRVTYAEATGSPQPRGTERRVDDVADAARVHTVKSCTRTAPSRASRCPRRRVFATGGADARRRVVDDAGDGGRYASSRGAGRTAATADESHCAQERRKPRPGDDAVAPGHRGGDVLRPARARRTRPRGADHSVML